MTTARLFTVLTACTLLPACFVRPGFREAEKTVVTEKVFAVSNPPTGISRNFYLGSASHDGRTMMSRAFLDMCNPSVIKVTAFDDNDPEDGIQLIIRRELPKLNKIYNLTNQTYNEGFEGIALILFTNCDNCTVKSSRLIVRDISLEDGSPVRIDVEVTPKDSAPIIYRINTQLSVVNNCQTEGPIVTKHGYDESGDVGSCTEEKDHQYVCTLEYRIPGPFIVECKNRGFGVVSCGCGQEADGLCTGIW